MNFKVINAYKLHYRINNIYYLNVKYKVSLILRKIKCYFGYHDYYQSQVASYGLSCKWVFGGCRCKNCGNFHINESDVKRLINNAFKDGVSEENLRMIAYGRGLEEIFAVYPEKRNLINENTTTI